MDIILQPVEELDLNATDVFSAYSPFVREFIYRRGWETLHEVQLIASHVLTSTDYNLLIPSSTSSGKTEACFFPILSEFYENPPISFGVLYIAPLKSLINDQFGRISELLEETGIPVCHWHGDVSESVKAKALKNPGGVLQITPESLESMLMNRPNDIPRLFCDLRYVVVDEIHTLISADRGNQILCQLSRIARLIGHDPRRVGLSATVGDLTAAATWLGAGSTHPTYAPVFPKQKLRWRLGMEHFFIQNDKVDQSGDLPEEVTSPSGKPERAAIDAGFEYLYDCVTQKKSLVFSNSREETEAVTATLRQIADRRHEEDVFLIHHGNLSAAIREEAEAKMKDDTQFAVACATVTMELGIDIGKLERVMQIRSPNTVSGFLQRLGRSGRRDDPPEMIMLFREESALPNAPLPDIIPWDLLQAIAVVQLYLEERFIEPAYLKKMPLSLLFQQTLSVLASSGALRIADLGARVLSLPPFASVGAENYKILLRSMYDNGFIELDEDNEVLIGPKGEKLIGSFKFYAVFKDSEDFTVRSGSGEIGTITTPPPVGDRFALAGRVWEVTELDAARRLVYADPVKGKMEVSWPGDSGEIHTRILERMKRVLEEDTDYPYLRPNARARLAAARNVARNTKMTESPIVHLGGYTYCMFPWLGTRSFRTLRRYLARIAKEFAISNIEFAGCYFIKFRMEKGNAETLLSALCDRINRDGIDLSALVSPSETPIWEKYDPYIPAELLRAAFVADRLRAEEIVRRAADRWKV